MSVQTGPESSSTNTSSSALGRFTVTSRGFSNNEHAHKLGSLVGEYVREFSNVFDLSGLDGVTVSFDYDQALLDLDRGYKTEHRLTPSSVNAVGVAMTPTVFRDGEIKSHILLNANFVDVIMNREDENFYLALHIIAHECAHVEATSKFNSSFPNTLLSQRYTDALQAARWEVILACWDEYAATSLSANYGADPTVGYEDTFLTCLADTRVTANEFIKAYRIHARIDQVLSEVCSAYGRLLKFSSYHLGNLDGRGVNPLDLPRTKAALHDHWFAPFFERLHACCQNIERNYGVWEDKKAFEALGDLLEDVLKDGGLICTKNEENQLFIDIPFSRDTMPSL